MAVAAASTVMVKAQANILRVIIYILLFSSRLLLWLLVMFIVRVVFMFFILLLSILIQIKFMLPHGWVRLFLLLLLLL
jgi:hypothetical protein